VLSYRVWHFDPISFGDPPADDVPTVMTILIP